MGQDRRTGIPEWMVRAYVSLKGLILYVAPSAFLDAAPRLPIRSMWETAEGTYGPSGRLAQSNNRSFKSVHHVLVNVSVAALCDGGGRLSSTVLVQ